MSTSSPFVTANTALILTLALDAKSQEFFNELRKQHFPSERNFLAAHLTLFHHLPGAEYAAITDHLAQLAAAQPALTLAVSGVRFLGRGWPIRWSAHRCKLYTGRSKPLGSHISRLKINRSLIRMSRCRTR
ncbi:2'-5' RNA ligase family protein [Hymenobacter volaticus]|uniref:2'-5' RNA ligase family protein n=1 Tax=Hymenobacter volaticus TaxID=2932254 RepID=A0ABY4GAB0_9BACT|nr:2'-5' RNA ligase family protein [Hymenobacter volaticus]UOQ67702.1 2'-5' RNA ligase family protein [Hymenobacter volaticus]